MISYFSANNLAFPWAMVSSFVFFIIIIIAWSLVWKGLALWRAARRGDKVWFVVLLMVNTAGILEILYLYVFGKKKENTI